LKTERPAAEDDEGVVEVDVEVEVEVDVVPVVDAGGRSGRLPLLLEPGVERGGFITIAWLRMSEWPRPHSSVHSSGKVPSASGVMCSCVTRPGTMSSFCRNSGTKNEWMTSSAAHVELDGAALGQPQHRARDVLRIRVAEGELELLGVTSMRRVFLACGVVRARGRSR
jgi:hypothetical protein